MDTMYEMYCPNHIEWLPDEILEYILTLVSPYKDLDNCKQVCKRWYRVIKSVSQHTVNDLYKGILNNTTVWRYVSYRSEEFPPFISRRYSHSSVYKDGLLYVFGGCASTSTTFNDLWTLDLTTRKWCRPATTGAYPTPKASATLTYYKNKLILFGGWTHPSTYPLHQAMRLFNDIRVYDIISHRWSTVSCTQIPPPMAGHSATVQENVLVVFGGLAHFNFQDYRCSNDVWCLDLKTYVWTEQPTSYPKPAARYGQAQFQLNNEYILIIGGRGGQSKMYDSDIWLLHSVGEVWQWYKVESEMNQWSAPHLWCHSACKVDDLIVIFSIPTPRFVTFPQDFNNRRPQIENPQAGAIPAEVISRQASSSTATLKRENSSEGYLGKKPASAANRPSTSKNRDSISESSGEQRLGPSSSSSSSPTPPAQPGVLTSTPPIERSLRENWLYGGLGHDEGHEFHMGAFQDTPSCSKYSSKNREKQMESLKRMEEKYKNIHKTDKSPKPQKKIPARKGCAGMDEYVLNISQVIETKKACWRKPFAHPDAPRDTILFSVTLGKGEIIMFGGVQRDPNCADDDSYPSLHKVIDNLYFISNPRPIV